MKKRILVMAMAIALALATGITSTACDHHVREYDGQFVDLDETTWYADAAIEMYECGRINGMDDTHFGPFETMSRAMFAMVEWRGYGCPEIEYTETFSDIADGEWYATPCLWCASKGIMTGYADGTFGAADPMTREQMVTILYRISEKEFGEQETNASLNSYIDRDAVSEWALPAMSWAVEYGIIKGKDKGISLAPQDRLTRAEFATIYMRWIQSDCFEAA